MDLLDGVTLSTYLSRIDHYLRRSHCVDMFGVMVTVNITQNLNPNHLHKIRQFKIVVNSLRTEKKNREPLAKTAYRLQPR